MRKITLLFLILICSSVFSQNLRRLNNYRALAICQGLFSNACRYLIQKRPTTNVVSLSILSNLNLKIRF